MSDKNPKQWKFGDLIENSAATGSNPTRYGFFVRRAVRNGRMNPGAYVELTDGAGSFWESSAEPGHTLTRTALTSVHQLRR